MVRRLHLQRDVALLVAEAHAGRDGEYAVGGWLMKTVTLPEAVIFGTMIGLGLTGFLLAKETRPWYVYILLALVNCIVSILVYAGTDALAAWLGG